MNKSILTLIFMMTLSDIRAESSVVSDILSEPSIEQDNKLAEPVESPLYLVDKIECVVCGPIGAPEGNKPITSTDQDIKRNMDGQLIPMGQQIQNEVISQQIITDKLPMDPTAADKYIETLKKQNNLTDTDLADLFEQIGRTFTEGLSLLNQQYQHEMFMHYKFKSQQVIPDDVVQEYFDQHPFFTEGQVELEVAYVDFNDETKELLAKELDEVAQGGCDCSMSKKIEWSSPMTVSMRDIADDKKFIVDMNPGGIVVHEGPSSFELYKLVSKQEPKLKKLEEVRSSIVDKLTREKLEKMLEDYNQEVHKFIDIINLS